MFGLSFALPAVLRSFGLPARERFVAEVEPAQARVMEDEQPSPRRRDDDDVEPLVLLVAAAWGASQFDVFTR